MNDQNSKIALQGAVRRACFLVMLAALLLGLSNSELRAQEQVNDCTTHVELIKLTNDELKAILPCDFIGFTYMAGRGVIVHYDGPLSTETHLYYPSVRYFLNYKIENGGSVSADAFLMLLTGAGDMKEEDFDGNIDRMFTYKTFVVGEYWWWQDDQLDRVRDPLATMFKQFLSRTPFSRYLEVRCFVEFDIATLPIEMIVESSHFKNCVEAG